jgi:hypothetical protein
MKSATKNYFSNSLPSSARSLLQDVHSAYKANAEVSRNQATKVIVDYSEYSLLAGHVVEQT